MAVTYFLLAIQAEIVTKTLGFVFGSILTMALLRATFQQAMGNKQSGDSDA
jgi:hypothetical protein